MSVLTNPSTTASPSEPKARAAASGGVGPLFGKVGGAVANIAAFGLLAGVFYLGHYTGWKLPKASELL
jgi:hypothetical protein